MGDELLHLLGLDPRDPEVIDSQEDDTSLAELMRLLNEFREHHELTQKMVADRMGTTQSAVSDLERTAGDPRMRTIQRYARAVNASLRWVVVSSNWEWNRAPEMTIPMRVTQKSRSDVRRLRNLEVVLDDEDGRDGNRLA
jgi:transcriptional regulator with XRE-family HTH domain